MSEPDYVVIRGDDLPPGWDGRWIDRAALLLDSFAFPYGITHSHDVRFGPANAFEVRHDGAVAQVYRPIEKPNAS